MPAKPKVRHLQTTISTTFALLEGADEITAQQPVQVVVNNFTPEAFQEAFETVKKARDDALKQTIEVPAKPKAKTPRSRRKGGRGSK